PHREATGSYSVTLPLAAGRAIVASDLACFREIAEESGGVVLVPPDDPAALAAAMQELLFDARRRSELEAASRRHAAARTWPAVEHRQRGEAMNAGDLAHVQHAYAFWGGMALHRSGFPAFLRAIRRPVVMTVHEIDSEATGAGGLPAPAERAYKRLFNRITFG